MAKVCSACKALLGSTMFHKNRATPDGLASYCKPCMKQVCIRLRETRRKATAASHRSNPTRLAAWNKAYYDSHREARIAASNRWQRENAGIASAKTSARRSFKLQATPSWFDADFVELLYVECDDLNRLGVRGIHHVDHAVPLKSSKVCGLHVQDNLRVIPAKDNIAKSNRFWPDMS